MNGRVILIISLLGFCAALPLPRFLIRRQVVQPTWLMRPDLLPKGQVTPVQVTAENLQEAAALRASIQKAVNEGRYVVATNPQQYITALAQLGYTNVELGSQSAPMPLPLPTMPMLPTFKMPNATWWQQPRLFFP